MARIERTKNAARNIFYGVILKIYNIAIPFLMRTAMIYLMGVQYLGLNSLFASILSVLNLAELGVGSAMVFSMYRPIAEDDETTICALMKLYRTYYRIIGLVIAVLGCAMLPFIPRLIKSDIPAGINIYLLYLLNLGATVLSYWLFAYKNSILTAHQRTDIASKISMVTGTIRYAVQILVLWITRNYYLYVIIAMLTQVLSNVATAICADRLYPKFKPRGRLDRASIREINKKIRDLFTSRLGGVIVNSVDTIVISSFLGLTALAVYQNYYFIMSSVMGILSILYSSITAGIGNSLITESREKNYGDLQLFTFIICCLSGFCTCCFLNLFQPFIELWVGEEFLLPYSAVICLTIYFFVVEVNTLLNVYKDASGIWHEDRFRPLVTAIVNLGMNITMVQFCGIYGVILSTVLSMLFVGMPWLLNNLFTTVFSQNHLVGYLKKLALYVSINIICCAITTILCNNVQGNLWTVLLLRLLICVILPSGLLLVLYWKTRDFSRACVLLNSMLGGRLNWFVQKVVK